MPPIPEPHDLIGHLAFVSENPQRVFRGPPSFAEAVAFLQGVEVGSEFTALAGFREWLVLDARDGVSLIWPAVARIASFARVDPALEVLSRDRGAALELLKLAVDFLREAGAAGGRQGIADRYAALVNPTGFGGG